jgi:hypothetical protein
MPEVKTRPGPCSRHRTQNHADPPLLARPRSASVGLRNPVQPTGKQRDDNDRRCCASRRNVRLGTDLLRCLRRRLLQRNHPGGLQPLVERALHQSPPARGDSAVHQGVVNTGMGFLPPASSGTGTADDRNGFHVESDAADAAQREQEWVQQSDDITARRGAETAPGEGNTPNASEPAAPAAPDASVPAAPVPVAVQPTAFDDDGNPMPGIDDPASAEDFPRFEGMDFAGPAALPDELIKVGASAQWRQARNQAYEALQELSAATSAGEQDPARLAELRESAVTKLAAWRSMLAASPDLQREILSRGMTFQRDLGVLGQLGVYGDASTVHMISVAVAQAGGAGNASPAAIQARLNELSRLDPATVLRMPGDESIAALAPRLQMDTMLGSRAHVDTTLFHLATMSDAQFEQLVRNADSVIAEGGLTRSSDRTGAMMVWGVQGTPAGLQRLGDGLSIAGRGLTNVGRGAVEWLGEDAVRGALGRVGINAEPLYVVPPGQVPSARPATTPLLSVQEVRPGMELDPQTSAVFRGGSSLTVRPNEVRYDSSGMVRPSHGVSLDIDPTASAIASRGAFHSEYSSRACNCSTR